MFTLATLTFALWTTPSWAADEPSAAQAAQPSAYQPSNQPSMGNTQATQAPPQGWTSLKGTVQAVDPAAKTLQIKDETGSLVQVPVDKHVTIKKDGEKVTLIQLQTGDIITLAKRRMSSEEKQTSTAN